MKNKIDIFHQGRREEVRDNRKHTNKPGNMAGTWALKAGDGQMDGRTENLPILQDFVPYRGHCPATAQLQPKNYIKRGKGTADHMMPLGDWLVLGHLLIKK